MKSWLKGAGVLLIQVFPNLMIVYEINWYYAGKFHLSSISLYMNNIRLEPVKYEYWNDFLS